MSIVSAFPHAKLFSVAINSICGFMITTENDSNLPFGVLGESFQTLAFTLKHSFELNY